jgi:hypothetical protein
MSATAPQLEADKAGICAAIAARFAPLKILVKVKDEPAKMRAWIDHHAAIGGLDALIVFDNMSGDPAMADVLASYGPQLMVVRFAGYQDYLHNAYTHADLYAALRASCRFYTFIDTDEFLALYDGGADRFHFDLKIIEFLAANGDTRIFPATWLHNLPSHADRFVIRPGSLLEGLQWGKPVISAAHPAAGIMLHNTQISRFILAETLRTNLFLLHRRNVSVHDRINVNIRKLISEGVLKPGDGLPEALAMAARPEHMDKPYVSEIYNLLMEADMARSTVDSFQVDPAGAIIWRDAWQSAEMQRFIAQPLRYSTGLFTPFVFAGPQR